MNPTQFDIALRAFCRRRPFIEFLLEFTSGSQVVIRHPEAIRRTGDLYMMRAPDGGSMVFAAKTVARLLDGAREAGKELDPGFASLPAKTKCSFSPADGDRVEPRA